MSELDDAFDDHDKQYAKILVDGAGKSYAAGEINADKLLNLSISMKQVQSHAKKYTAKYKKDLIQKGGSWVVEDDRKIFKPWFIESSKDQRKRVSEIITKGIKEGKNPGVKQGKRGGYPKNSIAAELHEYFNGRRSHASMVARTETRKIQYEGTFARFKENNVERIRWLHSTLPNARPDHLARHRKEYNIDEAPPLGEPNCRCVYVPVISKPGAELEPEPGPEYEPGSVAERLSDERLNNASDEILQEYAVFRKESEPVDRLVNETRDEARKHIEIVNKYPDMIEKEKQNYQSLLEMKEEWSKTAPELVPMVEEQMRESMKKINDWSDIFEKSYASQWDAVDKFNGALAEQRRLRNEYLDRVHPKLYIYDTAPKHGFKHVDITEQTPYTKYKVVPREASAAMIERERRADEFLGHMVAPHKLKNGIKSGEVEVNVKIGTYRSSASVGPVPYTRVNMEATAEARIFVHEISHHIEYNNIDIFHAASAYREQEATEAGLKKLSSITGINSYDASEVAYVGNYPHSYMGKFYNTPGDRDPTKPGSTEVISYGMEMLYDEPETLIVQHNKFFKWLIRTMN